MNGVADIIYKQVKPRRGLPQIFSSLFKGLFEIISDNKMESGNSFSSCKTTFFLLLMFESIVAAAAISRDDFPSGFFFGAGTSAYQRRAWLENITTTKGATCDTKISHTISFVAGVAIR
ncbi:uncharacterized protein LOC109820335 [Asparagus officinalis]|uniref:uncharacterized protein LOC109820335 n=1 Tax=Asparagus officinalis TaxID=4686 RepID=UPI00098E4E29|nr:uncharacterized protein LOC109820335 [Asparagus officinalis]